MGEFSNKYAMAAESRGPGNAAGSPLHPAWRELMRLCESMGYGEIERIKIHDGLPVLAEVTRQKVKLMPP